MECDLKWMKQVMPRRLCDLKGRYFVCVSQFKIFPSVLIGLWQKYSNVMSRSSHPFVPLNGRIKKSCVSEPNLHRKRSSYIAALLTFWNIIVQSGSFAVEHSQETRCECGFIC